MTVYIVVHAHELKPTEDWMEYFTTLDTVLKAHGARHLAVGLPDAVIEGSWDGAVAILEFPSTEAFHACYQDPAYQRVLPLRQNSARLDAVLVTQAAPGGATQAARTMSGGAT
ncbi:DUF1330 domain-containing protein [Streptomyces sp. SM11]|uniref:DUF1330 domain-containing protein n=1 Tax=Streptomyces sp. SM11 TaxID=565557 RepID=UPI000CD533F5|nr:DUF1330 domain-containing protein [Streptomyces sp. SM11]